MRHAKKNEYALKHRTGRVLVLPAKGRLQAAMASRGFKVNSLFTNTLCIFRDEPSALILTSGRADLKKLRGVGFRGVKLFLISGAVHVAN